MSTTSASTPSPSSAALAAATRLGPVHLTVADLDRSVAFYQDVAGMRLHRREDPVAALGTGSEDLLVLVEEPAAQPAGRHAGLFHVALLYPSREELARTLQRIAVTQTPIEGASDHGVSEAIYLPDPDGNGVELYADRPREQWPAPEDATSRVGMYTRALDLQALLALVADDEPRRHAEPGLVVGHLHLHVRDVEEAVAFYRDVVGFELMTTYPRAGFMAAGGYHHHLGINTWRGEGVPPAPADAVGLRHWTIVLDGLGELDAVKARIAAAGAGAQERDGGVLVRDPSGNAVLLTPEVPRAA